jgi:ABC-2 type transport system permease protein
LFFQGIFYLPDLIQSGNFDQVLTRPASPLLLVTTHRSNLHGAGNLITGMALILYAGAHIPGHTWTPQTIALFTVLVICANMVMVAIKLFAATFAFWMTKVDAINDILFELQMLCRYPFNIYPAMIRILLTVMGPLAFTAFYPTRYLLAIGDISLMFFVIIPAVCIAATLASIRFFNYSLRFYTSSGT